MKRVFSTAHRPLIGLATVLALVLLVPGANAQVEQVRVVKDDSGIRLTVDGRDFFANGMNWDYFPIGTNYAYSLWTQPDDVIKDALDREMALLRSMGVNLIRAYVGIPPKWVEYIHDNFGIYTALNHALGRYGVTVNGVFVQNTDYSDPAARQVIIDEVLDMVNEFKDTRGVLMWLLGNENNYGLVWSSAETEALPEGERDAARALHLYTLFGETAREIKAVDTLRPVAMANGDLQYMDLIAEHSMDVDIFGTNVYRGISFTDAFERTMNELGKPIIYTEFGADVFNARDVREDQLNQAIFLKGQWKEIIEEAAGIGNVGNSIGGMTFQWTDGWWKFGQETNLDVQDINASWPNDAYPYDYVPGQNNMNEEWWGIVAKGPTDARDQFSLYPRAAFYTLQQVHMLNPYADGVDQAAIDRHFSMIDPFRDELRARGDLAALKSEKTSLVRLSGLRAEFETFNTGGSRLETPSQPDPEAEGFPAFQGFDHMQSYYASIEASPSPNVRGVLSLNFIGHVAENPIDEIFYENRARVQQVSAANDPDPLALNGIERLKVYRAEFNWENKDFDLHGFYRTGHYHWGYEGDFFGLYPEANYGPNIDIYNGEAPVGFEFTGKRNLDGLKIAFGPELWWGANPTLLAKYSRTVSKFDITGMYQEDLDEQGPAVSSIAVPRPPVRKATLHVETDVKGFGVEVGGIWGGNTWEDAPFQVERDGQVFQDRIKPEDAFGGKVKLTFQKGRFNWYAQAASMGLVADGGWTQTLTYTGWRLKDSGSGNQNNLFTGLAINHGPWQFAPNFMWVKPIEGPMPTGLAAPARPRNVLDDPFAVRANRETVAGEFMITYDPTPATWMYAWDSDLREDAPFAVSAGIIFRRHLDTQDAAVGIFQDGRTLFAFPGAQPKRDVWESYARIHSRIRPGFGYIANLYAGEAEANGSDTRLVKRYGGDIRLIFNSFKVTSAVKVNDWGPFDYHRDFNLTYPLQLAADFSTTLGNPSWWDVPKTQFGVRLTWRSLDQYSPRYCPTRTLSATGTLECDATAPGFDNGSEWEIRTYLHMNIGN